MGLGLRRIEGQHAFLVRRLVVQGDRQRIEQIGLRRGLIRLAPICRFSQRTASPRWVFAIEHHDHPVQARPALEQPFGQRIAARRGHRRVHHQPVEGVLAVRAAPSNSSIASPLAHLLQHFEAHRARLAATRSRKAALRAATNAAAAEPGASTGPVWPASRRTVKRKVLPTPGARCQRNGAPISSNVRRLIASPRPRSAIAAGGRFIRLREDQILLVRQNTDAGIADPRIQASTPASCPRHSTDSSTSRAR